MSDTRRLIDDDDDRPGGDERARLQRQLSVYLNRHPCVLDTVAHRLKPFRLQQPLLLAIKLAVAVATISYTPISCNNCFHQPIAIALFVGALALFARLSFFSPAYASPIRTTAMIRGVLTAIDAPKTSQYDLHETELSRSWSFCNDCELWRPARAHHCSTCKRCVLLMDHHCHWINNCISANNASYFAAYLALIVLLSIYSFVIHSIYWAYHRPRGGHELFDLTYSISLMGILFYGWLLSKQIGVAMTNTTPIEAAKQASYIDSVSTNASNRSLRYCHPFIEHDKVGETLTLPVTVDIMRDSLDVEHSPPSDGALVISTSISPSPSPTPSAPSTPRNTRSLTPYEPFPSIPLYYQFDTNQWKHNFALYQNDAHMNRQMMAPQ